MIAQLHIETTERNGITSLKKSFGTSPFKVADIREDKRDKQLRLMLMNSSPGILDGDKYQMKIEIAENGSLHLQTQSYQRLFTMKEGASQKLQVYLAKGSCFCFLPHPSVPHERASFVAHNQIYLSDNCQLIWGEVLTCGRKLSDEVFLFTKYHNLTEIFLNEKLIVKENLLIKPALINVNAIGQLEGFTHQASLIYLHEKANIKELSKVIIDFLSNQKEIVFGVTTAPINGLIIRILGQKGEQLHKCLKEIASLLSAD